MIGRLGIVAAALLLLASSFGTAGAHYAPAPRDGFSYVETIWLSNGTGNYTDYTESTAVNGSIDVTSVLPNGTDSAFYYYAVAYTNNQGADQHWSSTGPFTFSEVTFHYENGTDNQTGYTNPYVWFFINNSLPVGATLYLLNSPFTVVSTSENFYLDTGAGTWVKAVYVEGNGTYERNDDYGVFTATYNWKAYFDPSTGYIIGYVYTETDSDATGNGFTWVDTLLVSHTSYPLTTGSAPSSSSSGGTGSDWLVLAIVVVVIVVVIVVVAALAARARRRHPLPKHSPTGQVSYAPSASVPSPYAPSPPGPPPPPVHLTPSGQPAVQQIVIKETVKVNCRYCGQLIDSTVANCPFCGAPRT